MPKGKKRSKPLNQGNQSGSVLEPLVARRTLDRGAVGSIPIRTMAVASLGKIASLSFEVGSIWDESREPLIYTHWP